MIRVLIWAVLIFLFIARNLSGMTQGTILRPDNNLIVQIRDNEQTMNAKCKEPEELIKAKQGCVATQQHLLFFASLLAPQTQTLLPSPSAQAPQP